LSSDGKATEVIGEVSRGGLTRGEHRACDHDLGLPENYIPCGIVDEDSARLRITFGSAFKTSDCIVDVVELSRKVYQKGIALSKKAMQASESRLERHPALSKWDILIRPASAP